MTVDRQYSSSPVATDRITALYREAMRLAEAARCYFDRDGVEVREQLNPQSRAAVAAESVRITARLLEVVSWLLVQQAIASGDGAGSVRLVDNHVDAPPLTTDFPEPGRRIAVAVRALYDEVRGLDTGYA